MENLLKQIEELHLRFSEIKNRLDISRKTDNFLIKKERMNNADFWKDNNNISNYSKEVENLGKIIKPWNDFNKDIKDLEDIIKVAINEKDETILGDINESFKKLKKKFKKMEFLALLNGKYDQNNVIFSIHAGSGGVDAQDWAQILERMFFRFFDKKKWKYKILNRIVGNEAGIKSVSVLVSGNFAYGYLKSENGVHRLVRISPFDAEGMRHTSFALVEVLPELSDIEVKIDNNELKIDTFGSSGPGGQSVNRTESAIRIKHIPTGIVVSCQNEKSQHQNKEAALKILKSKIYDIKEERKRKKEDKIKGGVQTAVWGKQIRSYVFQPYTMVKDHRTKQETSNLNFVLDGNIDEFIEAYLKKNIKDI